MGKNTKNNFQEFSNFVTEGAGFEFHEVGDGCNFEIESGYYSQMLHPQIFLNFTFASQLYITIVNTSGMLNVNPQNW